MCRASQPAAPSLGATQGTRAGPGAPRGAATENRAPYQRTRRHHYHRGSERSCTTRARRVPSLQLHLLTARTRLLSPHASVPQAARAHYDDTHPSDKVQAVRTTQAKCAAHHAIIAGQVLSSLPSSGRVLRATALGRCFPTRCLFFFGGVFFLFLWFPEKWLGAGSRAQERPRKVPRATQNLPQRALRGPLGVQKVSWGGFGSLGASFWSPEG